MTEPRTLAGFMELLPSEQIQFNNMKNKIEETYKRFGFLPINTPVIELTEVLLAKAGGETEKQMYSFKKGDKDLSLRFDLTVPLAKYVAKNQGNLSFPFRRYQIGKVYRGERPQKGRYREFYQCDIDIIGEEDLGLISEAELPSVIAEIFKSLGFDKFVIRINNRKILNGFFEAIGQKNQSAEILRIIDKLDKIGLEAVIAELQKIEVSKEQVEKISKFISIKGSNLEKVHQLQELGIESKVFNEGIFEISEVMKYMKSFGLKEQNFEFDLTIARGLDYYTGTVYETFLTQYRELGSVCSGGRYENLASNYTNKKFPGVGVSIGLTRLFYKLNELGILDKNVQSVAKVLVIPMLEDKTSAIKFATNLRTLGINTEVYLNDKKLKSKMKYADKLNIPFVVVYGENEEESNEVVVKNMETGEERKFNIRNDTGEIKKYIK